MRTGARDFVSDTEKDVVSVVSVVSEEMGAILSCRPLGPFDDFFQEGGDSLRAVELITRLTERYRPNGAGEADRLGSELLTVVFEDATPTGLAATITRELGTA